MRRLQVQLLRVQPFRIRRFGSGVLLAGACAAGAPVALAVEPGINPDQHVPQVRLAQLAADGKSLRKSAPVADSKKPASSSSRRGKKTSAARPKSGAFLTRPAAEDEAEARELVQLAGAELERRIAKQREILRADPRNEAARHTLGLIAVEAGNRILELDALGRKPELAHWTEVIRENLPDTLWRTAQLAKSGGRSAAALGLFYAEGILAERDPVKGCEQYARAARSGHSGATYQLALCKAASDPALARRLLDRAADQNHAGAQERMGRACIEGEKKDSVCAVQWLERAASQGRPSAMSLLGWLYVNDPERVDLAKSAHYYRAAAEAGDLAAQNNLGELYESGKGMPQDHVEAFSWYARAAEAGFPPAQLNLARLYAAGSGVAQNTVAAREWAERAQRQGQDRARELLEWLNRQP